jgi:hypothetical protein
VFLRILKFLKVFFVFLKQAPPEDDGDAVKHVRVNKELNVSC